MLKRMVPVLIITAICYVSNPAIAYDHEFTHPNITLTAVDYSYLSGYLNHDLGLENGLQTMVPADGEITLLDWLQKGSIDEDNPICRSTNHFHNPLKTWDQSYMSDEPIFVKAYCGMGEYSTKYSSVTWGTGYLSPNGNKISRADQEMGWDNAKNYYYYALTSTSKEEYEYYFAETFLTLGYGLHLIQDMSVPAHVRNDFTSHWVYQAIDSPDKIINIGNRFENYLSNKSSLIFGADPLFPSFPDPKITDFWDTTDFYKTRVPTTDLSRGLAEFANANYFSDYTIPNNDPTADHRFSYPSLGTGNARICDDFAPNSTELRKYISRNAKGECPQPTQERKADHFAAVSLLNEESLVESKNVSSLQLRLDENVHDTYAKELLPLAVGYSAALLDYFFRGHLQLTALPIYYKNDIQYVRVNIKNMTPTKEAMENGYFALTYRYTPKDGPPDGSKDKFGIAWYNLDKILAPCDKLEYEEDMTINFIIKDPIPMDRSNAAKFSLAFRGNLVLRDEFGTEMSSEVDAIIGKVLTLGEVKFSEEWDNGLDGNCTWAHTDFNLFDQNPANGTTSNIIEGDSLVKENKRDVGYKTARVNESFVSTRYNNGEFKDKLPIKITPNTYIQFKIDEMWINQIPPAPPGYTNHWQGLMLRFNNGLGIQYSTQGQGLYLGPNVVTLEFNPDLIIVDNIYQLFQTAEIPIPAGDMYLEEISFVQQLFPLDDPSDIVHNQHMEVDFIRIVEEKEDEVIPQP